MFNNCCSLINVPNISKWETKKVYDLSYMFNGCISLTSLPNISKWDSQSFKNVNYMFNDCNSLKNLFKGYSLESIPRKYLIK